MLRGSCAFFASELLTGPSGPPYFGRFLVSDHHQEWDDLVVQHKRLCILAPRDHGKSYYFNFAYPIWQAHYHPHGCGYIFSATQVQAEKILDEIKIEIETNPHLQHLVPTKKNQWSVRSIRLSNGHRIYARGFGTKVRGAHPDWIVVDDGLNDESMYSETVRKKQIDYFFSAITNMIIPGGQLIVVGTPFHAADLYAVLASNPQYTFKRFPAVNKEGKPLWRDRYNRELLATKASEIGSIRFAREFECRPVSDAMSLFPSYLFEGEPVEQFAVPLGASKKFWDELGVTIYMAVDFALSSSVGADFFVAWIMGKDKQGNRWIIDVHREKGMPYHRQLSVINTLARRYGPALIYLEANQMQRIFGDELIRKTDLPIHKFVTTAQAKNSLEKGVPGLRTMLENRKIRIPRGSARSVEMMDTWKSEMQAFTWVDGKLQGLGEHDDTVMAFWICDVAIQTGGFAFTFGDADDVNPGDDYDLIKDLTGVSEADLNADDDGLADPATEVIPMSDDERAALERVLASLERQAEIGAAAKAVDPKEARKKAPPKKVLEAAPQPARLVDDACLYDDPFSYAGGAVP